MSLQRAKLFTSQRHYPSFKEIQTYIEEVDKAAVEKKEISYTTLIDLSEKNKALKTFLADSKVKNYWKKQLELLNNIGHHSISPFDQVKGIYFFQKVLELRKDEQKEFSDVELILLKQAENFGNFHAAREMQFYQFTKLKNLADDKLIESLRQQAEKTAELHLTPGHFFAATTYIKLATHYKLKNNFAMQESAYFNALRHLYLAKSRVDISKACIHNAYFNESIENAFKKGYASVLNIPFISFDELIKSFLKMTNLNSTLVEKVLHDIKFMEGKRNTK